MLVQADGTRLQYVTDGHGDVKKLISGSGAVVVDYKYDAFGNQTEASGDTNPFRYSGEYYDAETGLIYLRARYYDSGVGAFTSADTHWNVGNMIYGDDNTGIPSIAAILQSGNLYVYCMGNPVNLVDPLGWAYIALRNMVDKLGGSISWDASTGTATVTIGNKTGVFIEDRYALVEGGTKPFVSSDSKMYVDEVDFYNQMGVISYGYSSGGTSGEVVIVSDNNVNISVGSSDFIIRDRRREANPAMEIMDCYKSINKEQRLAVLRILIQLEQIDPTPWNRDSDINNMEWEWFKHLAAYYAGIMSKNAEDAHIDNQKSGAF